MLSHRRRRARLVTLLALATLSLVALPSAVRGQQAVALPFAPGERLTYAGHARMGVSGKGTISVDSPTQLRGTTIWVLHSDMRGTLGPISAKEQNASWLNPATMTSLRYTSSANHLLKRSNDAVDIFAEERRWKGARGLEGMLVTEAPLDELSFLFFLRTLPLLSDTALTFSRHFDEARNPTLVRVVGREEVEVGAGRFHAIVVEMRVRDARRYDGEGVIRIYLSDDRCRLLLRLESKVPDAGSATLGLTAYEGAQGECTAKIR
jgi:hypothetical protein